MALELNLLPDVKKEYLKSKRQRNLVVTISILATIISAAVVIVLLITMAGLQVAKSATMATIGSDDAGKSVSECKNRYSGGTTPSYICQIIEAQDTNGKDLNSVLTVQNNLSTISSLKNSQQAFSRMFYLSPADAGILAQLNPAAPVSISLQQAKIGDGSDSMGNASAGNNTIELQGQASNTTNPNGAFDALNTYVATLQNAQISYSVGDKGKIVTQNLFSNVTVSQQSLSQNGTQCVTNTYNDGSTSIPGLNSTPSVCTPPPSDGSAQGNITTVAPAEFTIDMTYNKAAFAVNSKNISIKVPKKSASDAIVNAPANIFSSSKTSTGSTSSSNQGGE